MKVFVWESISKLTDNYHCGGGLVIFAETEERATEIANTHGVDLEGETPNDVRVVEGGTEMIYIMPDAGCC